MRRRPTDAGRGPMRRRARRAQARPWRHHPSEASATLDSSRRHGDDQASLLAQRPGRATGEIEAGEPRWQRCRQSGDAERQGGRRRASRQRRDPAGRDRSRAAPATRAPAAPGPTRGRRVRRRLAGVRRDRESSPPIAPAEPSTASAQRTRPPWRRTRGMSSASIWPSIMASSGARGRPWRCTALASAWATGWRRTGAASKIWSSTSRHQVRRISASRALEAARRARASSWSKA